MSGLVGSWSEEQQQVCRHLPHPIAAAWHDFLLARGHGQLEQKLHGVIEVLARTLGSLILVDYLRGPVDDVMEDLLQGLERPQPEEWLKIIEQGLKALQKRAEPKVFMPEALRWGLNARGEVHDGLARLTQAVQVRAELLRSTDAHVSYDFSAKVEEACVEMLAVLTSLAWLGLYRLTYVTQLTTLRHEGFSGLLQFYVGGNDTPEEVEAHWTAHLLSDVVYLMNASATEVLEISPFIRILHHPRSRKSLCFLFESSRSLGRLTLSCDAQRVTVETAIAGPDGEMGLADWLRVRAEHGAWLANRDLLGNLVTDAAASQFQSPRVQPVARPIPDLSAAAFRPMSQRHPSTMATALDKRRARLTLAAQLVVLAAVVAGSIALVGPRLRSRPIEVLDDQAVALASKMAPVQDKLAPDVQTPALEVAKAQPSPLGADNSPSAIAAVAVEPAATAPSETAVPLTAKAQQQAKRDQAAADAAAAKAAQAAEKQAEQLAAKQKKQAEADAAKAMQAAKLAAAQQKKQAAADAAKAVGEARLAATLQKKQAAADAAKALQDARLAAAQQKKQAAADAAKAVLAARLQAAEQKKAAVAASQPPPSAKGAVAAAAGAGGYVEKGRADAKIRPTFAQLEFEQALEAGDAQAHLELAKLHQATGKPAKCKQHALLAANIPLATACGAKNGEVAQPDTDRSTPAAKSALTQRIFNEAAAIIYGPRHTAAEKRRMAKTLYLQAGTRGLAKAWLGLARVHAFGDTDRAACRRDLEQYAAAGGKDPAAAALTAKCAQ